MKNVVLFLVVLLNLFTACQKSEECLPVKCHRISYSLNTCSENTSDTVYTVMTTCDTTQWASDNRSAFLSLLNASDGDSKRFLQDNPDKCGCNEVH